MDIALAVAVGLFGLAFGSFLNVCIYRLPRGLSVVAPRSACPTCQTPIRGYDNIPVLSWVVLRGRCRACAAPITFRYAAVELLTALLFLACYWHFGLTLSALKFCIFGFLVLGLIFTDAETKLLPDAMTLPGLVVGLLFSVFVPVNDVAAALVSGFATPAVNSGSWRAISFADALIGAAAGASFIYGSGMIYKLARGVEGMGFGDVKLMAMVGAFLGLRLTVFTIFGASILGSIFGLSTVPVVWWKRTRRRMQRQRESASIASRHAWISAKRVYRYYAMPFGVFLGAMAIFALFFGHAVLRWYWNRLF